MRIKQQLHIVIYSEILEYGGGRETWLEYFLDGVVGASCFSEIWVHHLRSRSTIDSLSTKIKCVHFNELNLGYPEDNNTLFNMISFIRFIHASLKNYAQHDDVVLFVGAGMESASAMITRLLWGKNIKILVWIRSIIAGEIKSRRSNIASGIAQQLEKAAFRIADRVIFNGKDTREYYTHKFNKWSSKFITIENAVNYDLFVSLKIPDFSSIKYNIGYIGRFSREKGFDNLIDSVRLLQKTGYEDGSIQLQAWGHGNDFNDIPSNIFVYGPAMRNEVPTALGSCHVMLFLNKCAKHEAGGLSHGLLEAMAAGRLIIAWDNVAHRQVLNESSAILVQEGNIEQLAHIFNELHHMDIKEMARKCENARITAKQFTIETHMSKFIQLVTELY